MEQSQEGQPGAGESGGQSAIHGESSSGVPLDSDVASTYDYGSDDYGYQSDVAVETAAPSQAVTKAVAPPPPPPPPPQPEEPEGGDEDGMVRMSFMEHLEELRRRIIYALMGVGVAFVVCLVWANDLWRMVSAPAVVALKNIGADPNLAQITPMDAFTTIWVKLPMLAAVFLASPWILHQVWAFIAPGLYKRERRWAGPFVLCTAGLFILGGCFAYFVAFRYGLQFLLSIGQNINVKPVVSLVDYFDLFVNVMLGVGLVFELPVLIFFLTLLRIVTPSFLLRNSRYAILIITIIAAIVTPTPDVFNLMLFTVPMVALFFVGIFAGYILVLHREKRKFPWKRFWTIVAIVAAVLALALWIATARYHVLHYVPHWPFLERSR